MNQITLQQFLDRCAFGGLVIKDQRQGQGQWCFNVLSEYRPDLAEKCRDTAIDPFYNDSRISSFIYWVKLLWNVDLDSVRPSSHFTV